jgi:hypothetical protein
MHEGNDGNDFDEHLQFMEIEGIEKGGKEHVALN